MMNPDGSLLSPGMMNLAITRQADQDGQENTHLTKLLALMVERTERNLRGNHAQAIERAR
jgi:hypothetical protein